MTSESRKAKSVVYMENLAAQGNPILEVKNDEHKLFSAVLTTLVILSIVAGSTVAFARTEMAMTNATKNVTKGTVASAANAAGFLGLPGFEAVYG